MVSITYTYASASGRPSFTMAGISMSLASLAAFRRLCPASISYPPGTVRTMAGTSTPCSRTLSTMSSSRSPSYSRNGWLWNGLMPSTGSICTPFPAAAVSPPVSRSTVSLNTFLFGALAFIRDHLLCQVLVCRARPAVRRILHKRLAVIDRLPHLDGAGYPAPKYPYLPLECL